MSTASLVLGVAAAGADHRTVLLTSVSGLIATPTQLILWVSIASLVFLTGLGATSA